MVLRLTGAMLLFYFFITSRYPAIDFDAFAVVSVFQSLKFVGLILQVGFGNADILHATRRNAIWIVERERAYFCSNRKRAVNASRNF